MTYHTNHSWCSQSMYDGKSFDAEAMVYFGEYLDNDYIREIDYDYELLDPDYTLLTDEVTFEDNERLIQRTQMRKTVAEMRNEPFDEIQFREEEKEFCTTTRKRLKPEILKWLDDNVEDQEINEDVHEIQDVKSWCVGALDYDVNNSDITVFFKRQLDALAFIKRWSIFKEPTFYFDYFHNDRRDQDFDITRDILLTHKLEIKDLPEQLSNTNLDPATFTLIDWETDED